MKFYIEITLLPLPEIPLHFLWEKVYQQIHLAFVEIKDSNNKVSIGVSFPEYDEENIQLGCKLRFFARTTDELNHLKLNSSLSRLRDYVQISEVRQVPENIEIYSCYKRIQTKSSIPRLARRKAKYKNIRYEEALLSFPKSVQKMSKVPYINMKSLSSDKKYRLMIGREKAELKDKNNVFSTYGLSSTCAVPLF